MLPGRMPGVVSVKVEKMREAVESARRFERQALSWQRLGFLKAMRKRNKKIRDFLEFAVDQRAGGVDSSALRQEARDLYVRSQKRDAEGVKEDDLAVFVDSVWNGHKKEVGNE